MVFVFPIMDRRVRPSGRSYSLRARRRRLGGRTWAEQTQDAGVLEAGHGRSGGRTWAKQTQDAGVLEAGRGHLGGRTQASWRQDGGRADARRRRLGGRTRASWRQDTGVLEAGRGQCGHKTWAEWTQFVISWKYCITKNNKNTNFTSKLIHFGSIHHITTCQTRLQSMTVFDEISGVQDKISGVQVCRLSPNLKVELVLNNVCKTC